MNLLGSLEPRFSISGNQAHSSFLDFRKPRIALGMTSKREFFTDTILVEFTGDLREVVVALDALLFGRKRLYPAAGALWWDSVEAGETYATLIEELNRLAPEGYYFGGHPFNVLILGFWPERIADVATS